MSFIFTCPYCKGQFNAQDSWVGQSTQCPNCHNHVIIQKAGPMTAVPAVPVPQNNQKEPKISLMARITSAATYGPLMWLSCMFIAFATRNLSDGGEILFRIFCILRELGFLVGLVAGPCGIVTLCTLTPEEKKQGGIWEYSSKSCGVCGIAVSLLVIGLRIGYMYYIKNNP